MIGSCHAAVSHSHSTDKLLVSENLVLLVNMGLKKRLTLSEGAGLLWGPKTIFLRCETVLFCAAVQIK